MKRFLKRKAFTIIEMVIVIAVIGILATVMIPTISGMIEKANESADKQFAASLNIQLALESVDGGIKNESDLRDAVNKYYGKWEDDKLVEDYYNEKLIPKSVKSGNYFWYDYNNGTVFVGDVDDAKKESDKILTQPAAATMDAAPAAAPVTGTFSPASLRSDLIPGLYLMGAKGAEGDLVDIITKFEHLGDKEKVGSESTDPGQHYEETIGKLSAMQEKLADKADTDANKVIVNKLVEKIAETAIITEAGAFRYSDRETVTNVYISMSVKVLKDIGVFIYNADDETVGGSGDDPLAADTVKIELPSGVKVLSNGVPAAKVESATDDPNWDGGATTQLHVNANSVEELKNIFEAFATDCVIVLPDGSRYMVIEDKICKVPFEYDDAGNLKPAVDGLDTSNVGKIDITITCPESTNVLGAGKIYLADKLYIAYDQLTTQLGIEGVSASLIQWSSSKPELIEVDSGKITLKKLPEVGDDENYTATITAQVRNSETFANLEVYIVRPIEASVKLSGNLLELPFTKNTLELLYTGNPVFNFTDPGVMYNQDGAVICADAKFTYVTNGTMFTVDSNTGALTVNPANITAGAQELIVRYGTDTITYFEETFEISVRDNSDAAFEVKKGPDGFKLSEKYLFRIGNENTVKLSALFENAKPAASISLIIHDNSLETGAGTKGEINGTNGFSAIYEKTLTAANWADKTIKFSGTGVAIITISTDKGTASLAVEVVNGKNVTTYSGDTGLQKNGNNVLLNNITMSSGSSFALSGATLYGNGYTFDVSAGIKTNSNDAGNYLVKLTNATLDNVKIEGKQYTSFNATSTSGEYNRPTVLATGTSNIYNSYISNCAAPVRVNGATSVVTIQNTTLKGGSFANLDIREGHVILEDVTTINQVNGVEGVETGSLGLGIVVWYEHVPDTTKLTVNGTLTQYNYVSADHAKKYMDGKAADLVDSMFGTALASVRWDGNGKWINTGIASAISTFDADNATIAEQNNYQRVAVKLYTYSGNVWTKQTTADNYDDVPSAWIPNAQGVTAPAASLNHKHDENYEAKKDGSDEYCYEDTNTGEILISFAEGGSKTYNPNILTASKHGHALSYTVKIDGDDYTGKKITFNSEGKHTVEYTYGDPYNYTVGENGVLVKETKTYTKSFEISVTVVKAEAKDPIFTFYGYGSEKTTADVTISGESVKTMIDNKGNTWIMPAATGTNVKSTTINGISVNCPTVHVGFKDNSSDFNWLYPVFLGVKIEDYANGGTAASATTIVSPTSQSKPAGITIVTQDKPTSGWGWSSGSGKSGSEGKISSGTYKNLYGWTGGAIGSDRSAADTQYGQFSYKAENGTTYYYAIAFERAAHECPSGGCVTPDTLVTLADGTQKEIQYVTYEDQLLVWNFYEGKYEVVPAAIIFNMGTDYFDVLTLKFDDGTTVKTINGHRFFDTTVNSFELISTANIENYVGHEFAKADGDSYRTVKLVGYSIENEYTTSYSIMSAFHYNFIVEGMFSDTFHKEDAPLFDYFQMGSDMMYDADQMQKDIEQYGLYTYEEFADYLTYEQFAALNVQYLKIAVEKGQFTYEGILGLIDTYLNA